MVLLTANVGKVDKINRITHGCITIYFPVIVISSNKIRRRGISYNILVTRYIEINGDLSLDWH